MPAWFPPSPLALIQQDGHRFDRLPLRDMDPDARSLDGEATLRREAVAWVVRLTSGEATVEDAEAFRAWRARSPAHEEAFRLASSTWRHLGAGSTGLSEAPGRPHAAISRRLFLGGAAAGAALAAGWAGVSLGMLPSLDRFLSDHATGVGEQARIDLPDGSIVELDGASALDARLSDAERAARLVSGAAAFDVARDDRPFRLLAGAGEITTLEGVFAVALGAGEAVVECMRGEIGVTCRGTRRLAAGERATMTETGVSAPEGIDPSAAAPWRRGLLVFEDRPLSRVVDDINRHRRGRVVLARPGLGGRRVSGVFHLDRPDEIVAGLAGSLKLVSVTLPGGIVLLR